MAFKSTAVARMARVGAPMIGVAVVALLALALPVGAASVAVPRPERWSQKKSANQSDALNTLNSVSCPSVAQCDAVGYWQHINPHHPASVGGTLVEGLRGGTWSITPSPDQTPDRRLSRVSCPTVSRCYAVGQGPGGPLILISTAGVWSAMATPGLTGVLNTISCATATRCVAVGEIAMHTNSEPYAVSLSDGIWTPMTVPTGGRDGNQLLGVSCPSATQCLAVGYRNDNNPTLPLAFQLSGGVWTQLSPPSRNTATLLQAVDCTSATRCIVVGASDTKLVQRKTLVERWSAGAWTIMDSPNTGGQLNALFDVDCTDFDHCIAVGQGGYQLPLIEKLGGGAWSMMAAPHVGSDGFLFGVDCPASSACFAVGGTNQNGGNHARSFIIRSQ